MILPKPEDQYQQEIQTAERRGWTVNLNNVSGIGPVFSKGHNYIWKSGKVWKKSRMVSVGCYSEIGVAASIETLI